MEYLSHVCQFTLFFLLLLLFSDTISNLFVGNFPTTTQGYHTVSHHKECVDRENIRPEISWRIIFESDRIFLSFLVAVKGRADSRPYYTHKTFITHETIRREATWQFKSRRNYSHYCTITISMAHNIFTPSFCSWRKKSHSTTNLSFCLEIGSRKIRRCWEEGGFFTKNNIVTK